MSSLTDIGIVIVAAGGSHRFGVKDKLLLPLNDMPLFLNSVKTFLKLLPKENLVIVTAPERQEEFSDIIKDKLKINIVVVAGGAQRSDSALNGLKALPNKLKYAGVHDAARPYITEAAIKSCYVSLIEQGSAVLAHPVTDTIKIADPQGAVIDTPQRHTLFAAETPQMFVKVDLMKAYSNHSPDLVLTDESMAMEKAGHLVSLVIHEEDNRKITYEKDLS
jgi:2-C-methyl-D-erythritol 4-phosphate cytidylyltransferase